MSKIDIVTEGGGGLEKVKISMTSLINDPLSYG